MTPALAEFRAAVQAEDAAGTAYEAAPVADRDRLLAVLRAAQTRTWRAVGAMREWARGENGRSEMPTLPGEGA